MSDLFEAFRCCVTDQKCDGCPRNGKCPGWSLYRRSVQIPKALALDVIEALKEMEPVEPVWKHGYPYCEKCGKRLVTVGLAIRDNYCRSCGRKVKWS